MNKNFILQLIMAIFFSALIILASIRNLPFLFWPGFGLLVINQIVFSLIARGKYISLLSGEETLRGERFQLQLTLLRFFKGFLYLMGPCFLLVGEYYKEGKGNQDSANPAEESGEELSPHRLKGFIEDYEDLKKKYNQVMEKEIDENFRELPDLNCLREDAGRFLAVAESLFPYLKKYINTGGNIRVSGRGLENECVRDIVVEYEVYTEVLSELLSAILKDNDQLVSGLSEKVLSIKKNISGFIQTINSWKKKYFEDKSRLNYKSVIAFYEEQKAGIKEVFKKIDQSQELQERSFLIFESKVDEIFGNVNNIQGIAEKVKVLSINASIEAARAGREGRGFKIVATEINKLSSDTEGAVDTIAGLIEHTVGSIRKLVDVSAEQHKMIHKGMKNQEEQVTSAFEALQIYIKEFTEMFKAVSELISRIDSQITHFNLLFQHHDMESQELTNIQNVLENLSRNQKNRCGLNKVPMEQDKRIKLVKRVLEDFGQIAKTNLEFHVISDIYKKYNLKEPGNIKTGEHDIELF